MNIVFFTHPEFFPSLSMTRFAKLLATGMEVKKHTVSRWSPVSKFSNLPSPRPLKKWLGYLDQYIVFPREVRKRIKSCPRNTLFVFTDNALGPWLPAVANFPHVMHCHDFLALRSALGEVSENLTSRTGQTYQRYIQKGYRTGKHFISDSYKTQEDLHRFLGNKPLTSEMVYVGLNPLFRPYDPAQARADLSRIVNLDFSQGYLLHVGGNQWYKNRVGVIELYEALCYQHDCQLPLLMIGPKPETSILARRDASPFRSSIHFLSDVSDEQVCISYAGASLFLFPSLAEGFGWPIAEAMASGCPVVTTNEAPMTEVAGGAAILIDRRPSDERMVEAWATTSAISIQNALLLLPTQRQALIEKGFQNANRFAINSYIDELERIYKAVLDSY